MRNSPTRSEALLWAQLRGRKLGVRFRRQHPLGRFVVDFFAPCAKLVVEVDGGLHDHARHIDYDVARERDVMAAVASVQRAI